MSEESEKPKGKTPLDFTRIKTGDIHTDRISLSSSVAAMAFSGVAHGLYRLTNYAHSIIVDPTINAHLTGSAILAGGAIAISGQAITPLHKKFSQFSRQTIGKAYSTACTALASLNIGAIPFMYDTNYPAEYLLANAKGKTFDVAAHATTTIGTTDLSYAITSMAATVAAGLLTHNVFVKAKEQKLFDDIVADRTIVTPRFSSQAAVPVNVSCTKCHTHLTVPARAHEFSVKCGACKHEGRYSTPPAP